MKSKKLISLLCAAALSASSFAGLAVTASAATTDDILWSDTFNSYDLTGVSYGSWLQNVLQSGAGSGNKTYSAIDGLVLYTGSKGDGDDSTYWAMGNDAENGNYLVTASGRFTTGDRGARFVFGSLDSSDNLVPKTYSATAEKDVVLNMKVKGIDAWETANPYDNAFTITGTNASGTAVTTLFDMTTNNISLDEWHNVKVVTTTSGTSIYVDDSTTALATSTATSITGLKFNAHSNGKALSAGSEYRNSGEAGAGTIAGNGMGYPSYNLDDIVVFNAPAGTGATTEVPPAQTHGQAVVEYETIPVGEAPENLGLAASDNLNDKTSERLVFINKTEADSTYTGLDSVILSCGTDTSTHSETKWEVTQNAKTDPAKGTEKYLKASSSVKSAANRGPKLTFKKGEIAERETVVAQFATRLHKSDTSPAEVIFSGDLVASTDKGNLASPLAMITTNAEADSAAYAVSNALEKGGANVIEVPDNKWVLVNIEAYRSEGKTAGAKISVTVDDTTKYIFGSADAYANLQDSTKSGINTLPFISFRSGNSTDYYGKGSGSNTVNDIDNIAVYSSTVDPAATPTPTPVPKHSVEITQDQADPQKVTVKSTDTADDTFDGVLIHVAYNTDKTLKSVKSYDAKSISKTGALVTIPEADTVYAGDKLMVWNSLKDMVPYGSADAKGVQTFAVTGTIGEGVAKVVFTDSTDNTKVFETTTGTVNVPAGTYALTVAAKSGYENAVVDPTSLTVSADVASGAFNATATKVIPKYAVKGTVDAGVATVTLTNKTDNSKTYTGSIDGTAVSFANVEEGTYTISATFVAGKEVNAITPAEITVDAQTGTDSVFEITSKDSALPAITGTVAIDGTAKVGQTLTATVTGLNDGKAAKYQWQANTGAEGAYVAIENATNATFEIPESLLGKTIKVVVTADGTSGSIESAATAAVAAKTYTVSGTVDAGVDTVKLHPATDEDHSGDIAGTIDGTTVTFANVVAGTYTVTATAKTGYKNAVSNPAEITVGETTTAFAVTTTKVYTVTGTVDAGVDTVKLHVKDAADHTDDIAGTIKDAEAPATGKVVEFANVPAGTYTLEATAKAGYKNAVSTPAEITVGETTTAFAVTTTAITLPDISAKTVMAENDFSTTDVWGFTTGRNGAAPTVTDGKLVLTKGNNSIDNAQPMDVKTFDVGVISSTDTEVMFDYNPQIDTAKNRWSSLSLTDSADNVIISLASMGNAGIGYAVGQRAVFANNALSSPAVKIANDGGSTNVLRVYAHLVKGETENKVSGYIFDVSDATPVFVAEIPETKVTAANVGKIVAQEGYSAAPQAIDNVKVVTNNANWKPAQAVSVTTPDETNGTLAVDKTTALPGTTVTITATAKPGKKVTGVTVAKADGTVATVAGDTANTWTFVMPEEPVTVSATYDRADIATITVSGPTTASTGTNTSTYTAVAKAADGTVLTGVTFAWSVVGATAGTTITDGVLTVAADETTNPDTKEITVKATAEEKDGTLAVTVVNVPSYSVVAKTGLTGGSVSASVNTAIESTKVEVTPEANTGYHVTKVTYVKTEEIETAIPTEVTKGTDGKYIFDMPGYAVTVSAEFAKTDYTITNQTAEAEKDTNHGFIAVSKSPANYQDEITITVTPSIGYQIGTLTVKDAADQAVDVTNNKFTMPASNVTISATFEEFTYTSIKVAPAKVTDVVVNKKATEQTVAMAATLVGDTEKVASQGEVTWSATGVEGVTINSSTGVLTIPANSNMGNVTVTATGVGDGNTEKTGAVAVRIDPELVTVTGSTTKIYVADDTSRAAGASIGATLKTGGTNAAENPVAQEMYCNAVNGTFSIALSNYGAFGLIKFDDTAETIKSLVDGGKLYSATLYLPQGYGYNTSKARTVNPSVIATNAWDGEAKLETIEGMAGIKGTAMAWTGASDSNKVGNCSTVDIADLLSNSKARVNNAYYMAVNDSTKQAIPFSVLTREHTSRGAYIEIVEGNKIAVKYTKDESTPVTGLEVTVTGPNSFSKTVTTDDEGVASVIVSPISESATYTFTTATGEYKATSKAVTATGDSTDNTQALVENNQTLGSIIIDASALNTGILTTTQDSKVVGKLSTVQKDTESVPMTTPEAVTWAVKDSTNTSAVTGISVASDGTVSITKDVVAGTYKITASGATTTSVSSTPCDLVIAATGKETVKAASEDFEGDSNILGLELQSAPTLGSVYSFGSLSKVAIATKDTGIALNLANAVEATEVGDVLTLKLDAYNGWVSGLTNTIEIKDAANTTIFKSVYSNSCNVDSLVLGTSYTPTFSAFAWQSKKTGQNSSYGNGYTTKPMTTPSKLELTITKGADSSTITAHFTVEGNTTDSTYTGTVTNASIGSLIFTTNSAAENALGIDNIQTTITRAAAGSGE